MTVVREIVFIKFVVRKIGANPIKKTRHDSSPFFFTDAWVIGHHCIPFGSRLLLWGSWVRRMYKPVPIAFSDHAMAAPFCVLEHVVLGDSSCRNYLGLRCATLVELSSERSLRS